MWLDRLIYCPDAQFDYIYKLSCLTCGLGLNQGDVEGPGVYVDVHPAEALEHVSRLQWAVKQVASMVLPSRFSSF